MMKMRTLILLQIISVNNVGRFVLLVTSLFLKLYVVVIACFIVYDLI